MSKRGNPLRLATLELDPIAIQVRVAGQRLEVTLTEYRVLERLLRRSAQQRDRGGLPAVTRQRNRNLRQNPRSGAGRSCARERREVRAFYTKVVRKLPKSTRFQRVHHAFVFTRVTRDWLTKTVN